MWGCAGRVVRGPRCRAAALGAAVACGCSGSVALTSIDRQRLESGSEVAVVFDKSPPPWVDCRGDEGRQVWTFGGAALLWPRPGASTGAGGAGGVFELASAAPGVLLAHDTWEDIEEEWTKSLRAAPPEDPARATAEALVALAARTPSAIRLGQHVGEAPAGGASPATGPAGGPVLSVRATRWVLSGCFFRYTPWFTARAILLEGKSGRVLWREDCGGMYPSPGYREAEAVELEADGKALYRSLIEQRAADCARAFLRSLAGPGAAPGDGRPTDRGRPAGTSAPAMAASSRGGGIPRPSGRGPPRSRWPRAPRTRSRASAGP